MNRAVFSLSLAVAFLISLAIAWLTPPFTITAVLDTAHTSKIRFRSARQNLRTLARPYASDQRVEIENRSEGDSSPVCFRAPHAAFGGTLRLSFFTVLSGDWTADEGQQTWCSNSPGSVLVLQQKFSSLTIPFLKGKGGASARLSHNGQTETFSLVTDEAPKLERRLRSPLSEIFTHVRDGSSPIMLVGAEPSVQVLRASFLDRLDRVVSLEGPIPVDQFRLSPNRSAFQSWVGVLKYSAAFLVKLMLVGGVFLCLGLALLASAVRGLRGVENIFLPILVGQALCACMMSCLQVFGLTFRDDFIIVTLGALLVVLVALMRSGGMVMSIITTFVDQCRKARREIASNVMVVFLGLFTGLQPIFMLKGWFVGEAYTDTWWYLNVSQILTDVSTRVHEPTLWSFQRMADLASISGVALIARCSVFEAYDIHLALSWILFALGTYCAALRVGMSRAYAAWVLSLSAFSSSLFALIAESYFAQFFFVQLLIGAIVITMVSLDKLREQGSWYKAGIIPVAVVYACALSVYPYHFVLPAAVSLVCIWFWWSGERQILPWLFGLGCATLFFLNVNAVVTINFGSNAQLMSALNDIAQSVVFPFYKSRRHLSVTFSLDDFHRHSLILQEINRVLWGKHGSILVSIWKELEIVRKVLVCCISAALVFGLIVLARARDKKSRVVFVLSVLYAALIVWTCLTGQIYACGKFLMTIGPLVPLMALLGLQGLTALSGRRVITAGVPIVCGLWLILDIVSLVPSLLLQEAYRGAPVHIKTRTHASVLGPDEIALARTIASSTDRNASVMFLGYPVDYSMSDKDRVLIYFLRNVSEGKTIVSDDAIPLSWHGRDYQGDLNLGSWIEKFNQPGAHYVVAFREPPQDIRSRMKKVLSAGIYDLYQKSSAY